MTKIVKIRKREEKRIQKGHLWIFSNEIESVAGDPVLGDVVKVLRSDGALLGTGLYNNHSLIAVRLLSRIDEEIDAGFFRKRMEVALELRRRLYPEEEAFRLIHGESDGLSGLVLDIYGTSVVVQIFSAGMEQRRDLIVSALQELMHPDQIIARNDSPLRTLEGLPMESVVLHGEPAPVTVREHGIAYTIDMLAGQKTGMFLDQKDNRLAIRRYLKGRTVLDCFSNSGGFALNAAVGGAVSVTAVDASDMALRSAKEHFEKNSLVPPELVTSDAFDYFERIRAEARTFGGIILDPPAFTKSKRSVATALKAYKKINRLALSVLEPQGILISASCSHHITKEDFVNMLRESAHRAGRNLQILEFRGAAADHPVMPAMPETEYLKLAICNVQ